MKTLHPNRPLLIAIDGPAASGKGTLARRLAEHLGCIYLDTGKLYRAVGVKLISSGADVDSAADFDSDAALQAISIAKTLRPSELFSLSLNDEGTGKAASLVAAIPDVRSALLTLQKECAADTQGAVLDGRDIGTVVCPNADVKFFITADIETRTRRRFKELQKTDKSIIYESVLQDLQRRDARDSSRQTAPLKIAEDAIVIDTTTMNMEQVFEKVLTAVLSSAS